MKILFIAVFDENGVSTNNSQANAFEKFNHNVIRYNYRVRSSQIGGSSRDREIVEICKKENPELVIFAKCNSINNNVLLECKKYSKVCYWFPDPLSTYENEEFLEKTKISDFFCCDKKNVWEKSKEYNDNSYLVCEGYDSDIDFPKDFDKDIDVSFIGNLYGNRENMIMNLESFVEIFTDAYGGKHSEIVSRSKINLNFCTTDGASDRIYKVLSANGFLITDDWFGREDYFKDGVDIVIYKDIKDLNEKIKFYLDNEDERIRIAKNGFNSVKNLSRYNWSQNILKVGGLS